MCPKLYIPSTLNNDYLLWHTQLNVCEKKELPCFLYLIQIFAHRPQYHYQCLICKDVIRGKLYFVQHVGRKHFKGGEKIAQNYGRVVADPELQSYWTAHFWYLKVARIKNINCLFIWWSQNKSDKKQLVWKILLNHGRTDLIKHQKLKHLVKSRDDRWRQLRNSKIFSNHWYMSEKCC